MNRLQIIVLLIFTWYFTHYVASVYDYNEAFNIDDVINDNNTQNDDDQKAEDHKKIDGDADDADTDDADADGDTEQDNKKKDVEEEKRSNDVQKAILETNGNINDTLTPADPMLSREQRNVHGMVSLQNEKAALYTMTPQFVSERLNESQYKYRWVADKWPKCKDECSTKAVARKVKCFGRNDKPYSDEVPLDSFYTVDLNKKDEFGKTKCDYSNNGIDINVKPSEQSFCSLLNHCPVNVNKMESSLSQNIRKEQARVATEDNQLKFIGFKLMDLKKLNQFTDKDKELILKAFNKKRVNHYDENTTYVYAESKNLELFLDTLTDTDKNVIQKAMNELPIYVQHEKKFETGAYLGL